jgi:2-oxoglutarate dehydrogenase complex dehydrogenase (E1) component-like enzyme
VYYDQPLLPAPFIPAPPCIEPQIRKLVLCSGKVYYDLLAERQSRGIEDVAIGRLEQISPFPHDHLQDEAKKYPNADIVWCAGLGGLKGGGGKEGGVMQNEAT